MIKLNGKALDVTLFPDNTSQVWKIPKELLERKTVQVEWEFSHEGEFMHLAQLKDLLDIHCEYVSLYIKYLPYGRQDKGISNEATFALTTFSGLLNYLNFDLVQIIDPHSEIALDFIDESIAIYPGKELKNAFDHTTSDMFCYPDEGAVLKYAPKYEQIAPFLYGNKKRNQLTGYIEEYELIGNPQDRSILVVDDICDGGMTFILLAKQLLEAGAKEVNLFVTHGIFSKGLKCLKEAGINRVFTHKGEVYEIKTGLGRQIVYREIT